MKAGREEWRKGGREEGKHMTQMMVKFARLEFERGCSRVPVPGGVVVGTDLFGRARVCQVPTH
eukprot:1275071-Prorocentrum_lima.AAC.1